MNKQQSIETMARFFGVNITPTILMDWLGMLEDYDDITVNKASKQLVCTCTEVQYGKMPVFAYMKKALDAVSGSLTSTERITLQAESEWNVLTEAISNLGRYKNPKFNPTTAYVLDKMGGWQEACSWETARYTWLKKEFVEKWTQLNGKENALQSLEMPKDISNVIPTHKNITQAKIEA